MWIVRLTLSAVSAIEFAYSYSRKGHHFTADVAGKAMRRDTIFYLREEFGGTNFEEDLRDVSVWADTVDESGPEAEYHFVHTPYRNCQAFVKDRDCGYNGSGYCLVTGIVKYVEESIDVSKTKEERRLAEKKLIHLFADLHQPMHSGFAFDHGGLDILLDGDIPFNGISLHNAWDYAFLEDVDEGFFSTFSKKQLKKSILVASLISPARGSIASLFSKVASMAPKSITRSEDVFDWIAAIVSEVSITFTCPFAYQVDHENWVVPGTILSPEYRSDARIVTLELLRRAGIRLAHLMDMIAEVWLTRSEDEKIAYRRERMEEEQFQNQIERNMYTVLEIEMDFDPEQLAVNGDELNVKCSSEDKDNHQTARRKPAALSVVPEIVDGVDISNVILYRSPSDFYYITVRERLECAMFHGETKPFQVTFTKNASHKRQILLNIDFGYFGLHLYKNPHFVRALIYKVRGIRYQKRSGDSAEEKLIESKRVLIPSNSAGGRRPNVSPLPGPLELLTKNFDNGFSKKDESVTNNAVVGGEDDSETEQRKYTGLQIKQTYSGVILVNGPDGKSIALPAEHEIKKYGIQQTVADNMFSEKSQDPVKRLDIFITKDLEQKCASMLMYSLDDKLLLVTSESSLKRSKNLHANQYMRLLMYEAVNSKGFQLPLLIDTQLLDRLAIDKYQRIVLACAEKNIVLAAILAQSLRPTLYAEMHEILGVITRKKGHTNTIIDQVYIYKNPLVHPIYGNVIEWALKPI